MSKTVKIWILAAVALILIGAVIFACAMSMLKWDFTKLSTNEYVTNEYEITEDFNDILVKTDIANLNFVISEDQKCAVSCYELTDAKHSVEVKDGTLIIELVDEREWYEFIGINFESPEITVYIPKGEYGEISVRTDTGSVNIPKELSFENIVVSSDTGSVTCLASASEKIKIGTDTGSVHVKDLSAGEIEVSVSTGRVTVAYVSCGDISVKVSTGGAEITNVSCDDLRSSGGTGSITLKSVIASGSFHIERGTGSVRFERSDATEIYVETGTGSVSGSLLSDKMFITDSGTGDVDVPKTASGGRCEITTGTGNIKIRIE